MKAKGCVVQFFLHERDCSWYTPERKRQVPTVFSRLPSLMAADKPCPQLQPSLLLTLCDFFSLPRMLLKIDFALNYRQTAAPS